MFVFARGGVRAGFRIFSDAGGTVIDFFFNFFFSIEGESCRTCCMKH